MSNRSLAIIGATFVAMIYGSTFTVAKDVMPTYVQPYGFILIRAIGGKYWQAIGMKPSSHQMV